MPPSEPNPGEPPVAREGRVNGLEFSEFLLRACHDLRAPLRSVRANAELLVKSPEKRLSPEFEQILGFIADGARSIDSLIDGLAGYSLALHIHPDSFQPVRVDALLRTVLAKLSPELRNSGAEVTYDDDLPRVPGDPDRLMQLLENLLRNAIQHRGAAAPRIHVGAAKQNGAWLFQVRDNGPCVEPEDLERIFLPFERLNRDGVRGPGLGLAICREIVLRHGGKIWAESKPEGGCTLLFTLPGGG